MSKTQNAVQWDLIKRHAWRIVKQIMYNKRKQLNQVNFKLCIKIIVNITTF